MLLLPLDLRAALASVLVVGAFVSACEPGPERAVGHDSEISARPSALPDARQPFYYYQGSPVELQLDPTRLVVEVPGATTIGEVTGLVQAAGVEIQEATALPQIRGHWLLRLPSAISPAALLRVTQSLRDGARARFVGNAYHAGTMSRTGYRGNGIVLINRLVVRFRPGVSPAQIDSLNAALGTTVLREPAPDSGRFVFWLSYPSAAEPLRIAAVYDRHASVEYADPDKIGDWRRTGSPSDPLYGFQYYMRSTWTVNGIPVDINVEPAWYLTKGGGVPSLGGITVAVIDDGVEGNHPDFGQRVEFGYDLFGHNEFGCDPECASFPFEDDSHGTQGAGTILGQHDNGQGIAGAAPDVWIYPVRIFRGDAVATDAQIAEGINNAWSLGGADVLSNSWGGDPAFPSNDITAAIDNATTQGRDGLGAAVVFAAGNTSARSEGLVGPVLYPGNLSTVVTVGAINRYGELSDYTAEGPALDIVAPSSHFTGPCTRDIDGPGDLVTTDLASDRGCNDGPNDETDYTAEFGGTSAAAPQVAAAFALVYAVQPELTLSQARSQVLGNTDPWPGTASQVGNGKLNVAAALGIERLAASIFGPSEVAPDQSCTWYATVGGGVSPYTYRWSGVLSGTASEVSGSVSSSGWLYLDVTSADGQQASDEMFITVTSAALESSSETAAPCAF